MLSYLEESRLWTENKCSIFGHINHSGVPLVLFGHTSAVDPGFLSNIHVEHKYIFDNNAQKWGRSHWGLEIISPNKCPYQSYNVLVLVPFEAEIREQLSQLPIPPQHVFRLDLYFEHPDTGDYYESHKREITAISHVLSDDISRSVFERVLHYRINRNLNYLEGITLPRNTQYFPEDLGGFKLFHDQEIFVDAGAFTGDTMTAFKRAVSGKYAAIYAFEPDPVNFQQMSYVWSNQPRVTCFPAGVGAREEVVSFVSDTSSSKISSDGTQQISVVVLDQILKNIPITYLKMDVEGMELAALDGAKCILQTYKPKLAICTYHSDSDMLEIPKRILAINPEYKLYFRHYAYGVVETVCYAV